MSLPGKRRPEHETEVAALEREQRAGQALELQKRGLSLREIGRALGVSHQTIKNDLDRLVAELHGENLIEARSAFVIDVGRVDDVIRTNYLVMLDDKLTPDERGRASQRILMALQRRARMFGYDGDKSDDDKTKGVDLDFHKLADEELAKELDSALSGVEVVMHLRRTELPAPIDATVVEDGAEGEQP